MQVLRIFYQHKENPLCVKVINSTTDYINKHGRDKIFEADLAAFFCAHLVDVCDKCGVMHTPEDYTFFREETHSI